MDITATELYTLLSTVCELYLESRLIKYVNKEPASSQDQNEEAGGSLPPPAHERALGRGPKA